AALIGVENTGVVVDECGFIPVDKQMRTNLPHIFAIGDIVRQPMLAHKATHERPYRLPKTSIVRQQLLVLQRSYPQPRRSGRRRR
ncbi:MAG TPA: FAD-dependent oxidoreductase, partial [Pseudolabrys sp.]|nr:FAD-dependent oxidoreductase [Pseudolabrys sp.]